MTALTPRLEPLFAKTKTVCFGRFMVNVPASANIAWGKAIVGLGVTIYPDGVAEVKSQAQKFIDELNSEKAINHANVPLLLAVHDVTQPEGKIVVGYEDFQSINGLKINGYFSLNNSGVVIDARPLRPDQDETIADIRSIAKRLRQHADNEIPAEPGNCIQYAFLPDEPGPPKEPDGELIRIGFRLKEFPDTHFSIQTRPADPYKNESNSLEWQLAKVEKRLKAQDPNHPRLKTKYFRRGKRPLQDWGEGFEALSRTPEQENARAFHDFAMDFMGEPNNPFKPAASIRLQTGVAHNAAGAAKAVLTDAEAIAVWDKITSTIRVRPTADAVVTSAQASPRRPLGELAATGRTCPQTGWWEPDVSDVKDGKRQHIKAGERMPHVVAPGQPSIWQKLKGERPTYRAATVWKLVSYDDAPAPKNEAPGHSPTIAEASSDNARAKEGKDDEPSPEKKG